MKNHCLSTIMPTQILTGASSIPRTARKMPRRCVNIARAKTIEWKTTKSYKIPSDDQDVFCKADSVDFLLRNFSLISDFVSGKFSRARRVCNFDTTSWRI